MSTQIKFMHRHLPTGHSVSIGYEFPDNHVGEVKIAFAFKSPKDFFSRKKAHEVIRKCFAEGDFTTVIQNNDKHIIDIIVDAFNDVGMKKMPESWKKFFPEGLKLQKSVDLKPVSISNKAAEHYIADAMDEARDLNEEVIENRMIAELGMIPKAETEVKV